MSNETDDEPPDPIRLALLAAIIGSILYSTKGLLVKAGIAHGAEPLQMLGLRMLYASPIYLAVLLWTAIRLKKTSLVDAAMAFGLGLLGFYLAPMLNFIGLGSTSASLERILIYACPAMILLLAWTIGREALNKSTWIALAFSYLGVAISLFGRDGGRHSADPFGAGVILAGCLAYALFVVASVPLQKRMGVNAFTSIASLAGATGIVAHLLFTQHQQWLVQPSKTIVLTSLVLALFATVIPSYLLGYAVRNLGAGKATIAQMTGPLVTPVLAAMFLGERMSPPQILGFALVLLGGWKLSQASQKAKERPT